ncbi:hypothetical protein [Gayadomonas joobiniege]|uniref:hypothetical protein n=1 Tax=Gayadomonas joobiniege TaxID=1234606 RepID=UPI000371588A|nr:hypothetical protein [Gayadomonas joobiniege]
MKKLSKVQLKQQAAVLSAVNQLEQKAFDELTEVAQCWFSMDYERLPASILVRVQFKTQTGLTAAEPELLLWQKRLSALLFKRGFKIKDLRKHLVFTLAGPDD